jgi:uncharacterized repeat protein (TIGR03803 family)
MKNVQEPTVRKTLATSRIPWQLLIGLVAAIVVMSIAVVSGEELKHVPPAAPSFRTLHTFTGGASGGFPAAALVRDAAGNLYGTTVSEGASGHGVVFELIRCDSEPSGYEFKVLYSFTGGADGGNPYAGLIRDAGGNLYGTTTGGGSSNRGTVFKLTPTGTETVLYSFTGGADGGNPYAGLVRDAGGNLYGTTVAGGGKSSTCFYGCGVVFKLSPTGTETVLHSFTRGADGGTPYAGLIQDAAGNLYGTTASGGATSTCGPPYGCGVVFKLTPARTETVLYSFTGGADGAIPFAGLLRDGAGNLYGTTSHGGVSTAACGGDCGVVFMVSPTGIETVLYSFTGGADGAIAGYQSYAGFVQDAAGNLYSTTPIGGQYKNGVVFKLSSAGAETILYSFTGGADGASPVAGLLRDAGGNFYGTTYTGANQFGVVFRLTP